MFTPRKIFSALAGVGLLAVASASHGLAIGDGDYVGVIVTCIPSSGAEEEACIDSLTAVAAGASSGAIPDLYDRTQSTLVPAGGFPAAAYVDKDESENNSVNLAGSFLYILAKYDQEAGGSLVWYNEAGFTGNIEVPLTYNDRGVSHISWFNEFAGDDDDDDQDLPEPGTLALLGLGLLGLGLGRRRRNG